MNFHPGKRFPDVSFYQGAIDWVTMRAQTDAVIVRAGQRTWPDPKFAANWRQAREQGMTRGCYWFYDDRASPGEQADLLLSLIQPDPPEMEVWIDWETSYGGAFAGLGNVVAMMEAVERGLPGARTGTYTGYYWWREHTNPTTHASQYRYVAARPLWLAWYTDNPAYVLIPAPWTALTLWQYGTPAIGADYGVQSVEIDMNAFNGTADEFAARYGAPPPPPQENTMEYREVTADVLNIRSTPDTSQTPIGKLYKGDIVEGDRRGGVSDYWLHLTRIHRAGVWQAVDGWCNSQYTVPAQKPPEPEPLPEVLIINGLEYRKV